MRVRTLLDEETAITHTDTSTRCQVCICLYSYHIIIMSGVSHSPEKWSATPLLKRQKLDHSKKRKRKKEKEKRETVPKKTITLSPVSPVSHQKYPLPATSNL